MFWHLGTEHFSVGEYDENGSGSIEIAHLHELAGKARQGFRCNLYDEDVDMFTDHYDWQYYTDMEVGQTYEVHWPHSTIGACGTLNQLEYQMDGEDCMWMVSCHNCKEKPLHPFIMKNLQLMQVT